MFLSFCQYDRRTAFLDDRDHFLANKPVSGLVIHQFSAEVVELDSFIWMRLADRTECGRANEDMMLEWSSDRLAFCIHAVANRSALHEHDGVMPVFAGDCRGQSREILRLRTPRDLLEAERREVVAFVDDDVTVLGDAVVNRPLAHEALNQCDVERPRKSFSSSSDSAYRLFRQIEKRTKSLNPLIKQLLSVHQHERIDAAF